MRNGHDRAVLDEVLEPLSRCFDLETARALVNFRIDERAQTRVERLAQKSEDGKLTPRERTEYEAYVQASTLIGILQAKARRLIAKARRN
jgi:hypothetical protein